MKPANLPGTVGISLKCSSTSEAPGSRSGGGRRVVNGPSREERGAPGAFGHVGLAPVLLTGPSDAKRPGPPEDVALNCVNTSEDNRARWMEKCMMGYGRKCASILTS